MIKNIFTFGVVKKLFIVGSTFSKALHGVVKTKLIAVINPTTAVTFDSVLVKFDSTLYTFDKN